MTRGSRAGLVAPSDDATGIDRRSTTRSCSTAAAPCPTRAALAAARRARPEPHLRPGRLTRGPTTAGAARAPAPACSAASSTSCTSARSPPEGTLDAATEPARPPRRPRRRRRRADAGRRVPRPVGLGVRRRRPVCGARRRTAARRRLQRFVDACHARGLGVCLDVVYNHLGAERELPGALRPVLHRPAPHAVGRGGQPRRTRAAAEVRRFVVDNALRWFRDFHVDALRLDAVHALARRLAAAPAGRAVRRGRAPSRDRLGRPLDAGRRERPQRPGHRHADEPRAAAGMTRPVGRRRPPRPARRRSPASGRATTPTSPSGGRALAGARR